MFEIEKILRTKRLMTDQDKLGHFFKKSSSPNRYKTERDDDEFYLLS